MAMEYLTNKQYKRFKSPIIDINNHLNEVFPFFDNLKKNFLYDFT